MLMEGQAREEDGIRGPGQRLLSEFGSDLQPSSKLDRLVRPDRRVREPARPRSCCTSYVTIQGKKSLGVINQTSETSWEWRGWD